MSVHIEWLDAAQTCAEVLTPGEDWVGAEHQQHTVLALSSDEVVAIEGTPAQLRALAARITAVTATAEHRPPIAASS
ncbi:MAG: hypothetical protein L0H74_00195 [Brachybacterium sp.]|nr:hypothetical protein [Brachybacterium sp.]